MIYQIQQEKIISSMINRINQELNLDNIDQSILILDFSKVNFMDSEGISWIVDILNTLDKKGIGLKIINVKKEVYKIFEITMLDTIIDIKLGISL
ncbi:MAG TPA: STAS domain-containing protein [Clostridia bacterium]|nr:STAS domain-containing protein [Clostridia bacterium]